MSIKCRLIGDSYNDRDGSMLYAISAMGETYCIHIVGHPFTCYIDLPLVVGTRIPIWNAAKDIHVVKLQRLLKEEAITARIVKRRRMWLYDNKDRYYLKVYASTKKELRDCEKKINKIMLNFNSNSCWYEQDIKPTLKFFIDKDINPSDLVIVDGLDKYNEYDNYEDFLSSATHGDIYIHNKTVHLNIHASHIAKCNDDIQIYPRISYIDIETWSHSNKFPDPLDPRDVCYLCSIVTETYRKPETRIKELVAIGGKKLPVSKNKDYIIHYVNTEKELLIKIFEILASRDTHVISGYNIHNFDINYIETRMAQLGINIPDSISRIPNTEPNFGILNGPKGKTMSTFDIEGIIVIDLYNYIRTDTQFAKLASYKLKDVLQLYVPNDIQKIDLHYTEQFKIFYNFIIHGDVDKYWDLLEYCLKDSESLAPLAVARNVWESTVEMSNVQYTSIQNTVSSGSVRKSYPMIYRAVSKEGIVMENNPESIEIEFEGGYNYLASPGVHEDVAMTDFNSLYPSRMREYNLSPETRIPQWVDIPQEMYNEIKIKYRYAKNANHSDHAVVDIDEDSDSDIEGEKTVAQTKRDIKKVLKGVTEYEERSDTVRYLKSEYYEGFIPKLLTYLVNYRKEVKKEIATTTAMLVNRVKALNLNIDADEVETYIIHDPWDDLRKRNVSEDCIAELCVIKRKVVDLDIKQNSIKVVANSIYGIMGSMAEYADPYIAATTCTLGRIAIKGVAKLLTEHYPHSEVVYIDTDSVFIKIKEASSIGLKYLRDKNYDQYEIIGDDPETLARRKIIAEWKESLKVIVRSHIREASTIFGNQVTKIANTSGLYGPPMNLAFEGFGSGAWIAKKMYAMTIIDENGVQEYKLRGIPLRRGDYALCVRETYRDFLYALLDQRTVKECMRESLNKIKRFFSSKTHVDEYAVLTDFKSISAYESSSAPMARLAICAAKMGVPLEDYSKVKNVKVIEEPHLATMDMLKLGQFTIDRMTYYKMYASRCDKTCSPLLTEPDDGAYFVDTDTGEVYMLDRLCKVHQCYKKVLLNEDRYYCPICSREKGLNKKFLPGMIWKYKEPYGSLAKLLSYLNYKDSVEVFRIIYDI